MGFGSRQAVVTTPSSSAAVIRLPSEVTAATSPATALTPVGQTMVADGVGTVPGAVAVPRETGRLVRRALRWGLLAVSMLLLARFARHGWPEIRASFAQLGRDQAPLIGLAVLLEVMWMLCTAQVYRRALIAFGGHATRSSALRIALAACAISRILPGGGATGSVFAAREFIALGNPALRTVASMMTSWWLVMTGLSAVIFVGTGLSAATGGLAASYVILPGFVLAVFLVGGAIIVVAGNQAGIRDRLGAVLDRAISKFGPEPSTSPDEGLGPVRAGVRARGLVAVFGWGTAGWIFDGAALWAALAAFGWRTNVGVLLVGYGVANLISALPELTPGWLGVLEASLSVTFAAFGVPVATAVVAVLTYRLVSYWLPVAVGMAPAMRVLARSTRTGPGGASPQEATA